MLVFLAVVKSIATEQHGSGSDWLTSGGRGRPTDKYSEITEVAQRVHERWDMLQALARSHARSVGHVKASRGEAPSVDLSAVHKDADMQRCLGLPVPDTYPAITSERLHPPSAGRHFTFTTACHVPTTCPLRSGYAPPVLCCSLWVCFAWCHALYGTGLTFTTCTCPKVSCLCDQGGRRA